MTMDHTAKLELDDKVVLVTGGTGSFDKRCVENWSGFLVRTCAASARSGFRWAQSRCAGGAGGNGGARNGEA